MSRFKIVFGINVQNLNGKKIVPGCEHSIKSTDNFCSICGKPAQIETKLNIEGMIKEWLKKEHNQRFLQWNDEINDVSEIKFFSISFNPDFGVIGFSLNADIDIEQLFDISPIFSITDIMKETIQTFFEDNKLPFNNEDMKIYIIIENI